MTRFRDLIPIPHHLPTGRLNAIIDVPGLRVGHATRIEGEGQLRAGQGPIRTGVTAVLPHGGNIFRQKVPAAVYTINGYGKATGFEQVRHIGVIESPICLTGTLNVGRVWDALVSYAIRENPDIAIETSNVSPVVGECHDGFLNDAQGRHIGQAEVWQAVDGASASLVEEGCVGGGVGTRCYGFKGGIGTASRQVADGGYTVGALLQTNFGRTAELHILGVPVGRHFAEDSGHSRGGSVMIVIATDAPLNSRQLERMAKRAAFGLGRTGTVGHHGSGDFVIAFSTQNCRAHDSRAAVDDIQQINEEAGHNGEALIDSFFRAVVECVEESVYNALIAAETVVGRDGHVCYALPHDKLLGIMRRYGRLQGGGNRIKTANF